MIVEFKVFVLSGVCVEPWSSNLKKYQVLSCTRIKGSTLQGAKSLKII